MPTHIEHRTEISELGPFKLWACSECGSVFLGLARRGEAPPYESCTCGWSNWKPAIVLIEGKHSVQHLEVAEKMNPAVEADDNG